MTERNDDRVLLTGLSGFVAAAIASDLLREGYRVRGTVRTKAKGEETARALERAGCDIRRLETVAADLSRDAGWDEAMAGCRFVQHTASPFPRFQPRDRFALVPVAREGTLRVIEAAKRAGAERVVLTSSVVAVYHGHGGRGGRAFTEADHTDVDSPGVSAYAVSKTLAERAAWEAVEGSSTELAVINPALVLGPVVGAYPGTSVGIVEAMMRGQLPAVPDARFGVVDVRDVAAAHVAAMRLPQAAGRRFIVGGEQRSLLEIGAALGRAFPSLRRLPRYRIPNALVRAAGLVSMQARMLANELDPDRRLDDTAAREVLGLSFRSADEAVVESARSLMELGRVRLPAGAIEPRG